MWEDNDYCWVVLCKNTWFHLRKHLFSSHRIPLGETDAVSPLPPLSSRFQVRCDECGSQYLYKPSDVRRYEQELPPSFVPHPLFRPGGDRRRSGRTVKQVRLLVRGTAENGAFEEKTYTISTSAHGALIGLSTNVEVGQTLFLTEPRSQNQLESKVVRISVPDGGRAEVGVEFVQPSPKIWTPESEVARNQRQAS
jgi:PilZ domain-containing protein